MNMVIASAPVMFINPFTNEPDSMPIAMIAAYVPFSSMLNLEQAAKVASIRDADAALNLMESVTDPYSVSISESVDEPSVEPPSLR